VHPPALLTSVVLEAPRQGAGARPVVSVIIPAHNEARRIPSYLDDIRQYFTTRAEPYEVLVVDDGSRDDTADVIRARMGGWPSLGLVHCAQNRGKGHAIRVGMLAARGRLRLMADADGSTPIGQIERLRARIAAPGPAVAVGSRRLRAQDVRRSLKPLRRAIGRLFGWVQQALADVGVNDTQCGFKLFDAAAAEALFRAARVDGFAFDVEILYLARKARIPVVEVAVAWHDSGTSRVNFLTDPARMVRDVWRIRRMHRDTVVPVDRNTLESKRRPANTDRDAQQTKPMTEP
jgi:dolichyl-phosphate beta-glucosyltransferase